MELTTITRKQAGLVYAAAKNGELDMDKAMIGRMYDEADFGPIPGNARDRKVEVRNLIDALVNGETREAQMHVESLWGDEAKAEAIAEELEASDKAEASTEADAAEAEREARIDAMLAKCAEITGRQVVPAAQMASLDTAERALNTIWKARVKDRWSEVEAAGEAAIQADAEEPAEPETKDEDEDEAIAKIDAADKLVTAESVSNFHTRIAYCAAHGEPFEKHPIFAPNAADVMARFRRLWRAAHPDRCGHSVRVRASARHARRCPAAIDGND